MNIPIYRPWLGQEEAQAAGRPILSGWITQGPEVAAFENEFAAYVGSPQAVAVANCTVALQLALVLAGVGPGDEVITVSHSYIATANSIHYVGATPVFADIESDTFNLDPSQLDPLVSPATKALLVVHQIGLPCNLAAILAWAQSRPNPLVVIEDAACAVGSEILWRGEWQKIGRPHGDIACFSFHPRKLLTTGDGGMLTMHSQIWAERARRLRQHAMTVSDQVRHQSQRLTQESYPEVGYNFRLTDIQAAVGREQLKKLPQLLERRRQQVAWYRQRLSQLPLIWPRQPEWARSNWQSLAIILPPGWEQATVMQSLLDRGIATRRGIMCAHREPAYSHFWRGGDLARSEAAQDRVLLLPLYHEMTQEQQEEVAKALEQCSPS